jgi:hypothetical protein
MKTGTSSTVVIAKERGGALLRMLSLSRDVSEVSFG